MSGEREAAKLSKQLASLVERQGLIVTKGSKTSERGVPQVLFRFGRERFALTFDPARNVLKGYALDGPYFPQIVAEQIDL